MEGLRVLCFIPYIIGVIYTGLAVPLALGAVGPNNSYGIRTQETMSNIDVWYAVNIAGGKSMVLFGLLSIIIAGLLQRYWGIDNVVKITTPLIVQTLLIMVSVGVALPS